jgi:hypothetical protein
MRGYTATLPQVEKSRGRVQMEWELFHHMHALSLSRLVGTGQEAMVAVTAPVAGPRAAAADLIGWIGRSTTEAPLPSPFFRCAPCVRLLWGFGRFPPSLPPLYLFVCNLSWPIMKPRCDTKYG